MLALKTMRYRQVCRDVEIKEGTDESYDQNNMKLSFRISETPYRSSQAFLDPIKLHNSIIGS